MKATNHMNNSLSFKIAIASLLAISTISISLFSTRVDDPVRGEGEDIVDCSYYFAESNGYTSLHEIVGALNDGIVGVSYKTWGTVTKYYVDSSSNKDFYVQSTDAEGNVAGMMIYRGAVSVSEGSVLTLEGAATLYNNLPQFNNPSITVDYLANSSPVVTHITAESFWFNGTDSSSSEFLAAESMGTRKIAVEDVRLAYLSSGNATVEFAGGTTVPLYYSYLSNTSSIDSAVQSLDGYTIDVNGYLNCYSNGYSAMMQCLIRSADDIIAQGISYSLALDSSTYTGIGGYATGNYGEASVSGCSFEHYRAIEPYDSATEFIILLPFVNYYNDGSASGSLYNISSIKGIESIEITYRTEALTGRVPTLLYGSDISCSNAVELALSSSNATRTIEVSGANHFRIETSESRLYIQSISIAYTNSGSDEPFAYLGSSDGLYRINPIVSSGSLYEGKSVTVPTSIIPSGATYAVQSTKTYTYYSFSYIQSYPSLADEAAYIDPIDVAAYFTIFGTSPANYVLKSDYSAAYSVFDDEARCVSSYTRTDGYASSVPYQTDESGYPLYYECDIALDPSYSGSNRGVGRVVCWSYGFDEAKGALDYDGSPVCVYTDDHYATFQEYLNAGAYGTRFNVEMLRTSYRWGLATTLMPA